MRKTKRINARLTEETAEKLMAMAREAGCSVSEVIAGSIDASYARSGRKRRTALEAFEAVGFIGCAKGDRQLSVRYKSFLTKSLGKKV